MTEPLSYSAAFVIGLVSGAHCIGMCGGIIGALTFALTPRQRSAGKMLPILLGYNLGRILSYASLGALFGLLSSIMVEHFLPLATALRWTGGLLLIAMGAYLAGWWSILKYLERAGASLWRGLQPVLKRLMPITSFPRAVAAGLLWGFIPCGLIYSTLTWAATSGHWLESGLIMLSFGAGTLLPVMATGFMLERIQAITQARSFRMIAGIFILVFGFWTLPLHFGSPPGTSHAEHQQP